jgi:hypothetical protein
MMPKSSHSKDMIERGDMSSGFLLLRKGCRMQTLFVATFILSIGSSIAACPIQRKQVT